MKKIFFFINLIFHFVTYGQNEFISTSDGSKLTDASLALINKRLKKYEVVDFDHRNLDKYLKNTGKIAKIKIGKNISGTWNFEENELRSAYIGKSKYDNNGNILDGVEPTETYSVKSDNGNSANIRLFISPNLIAGFIHDKDAFVRIESLSYFLNSGNEEYLNKIIIYDDRDAIITNEIKCGVIAKQITKSTSTFANARIASGSCDRLLKIAVETDDEFAENINLVMQEVDYILNLNFNIKVSYFHKEWNGGDAGYPYTPPSSQIETSTGRVSQDWIYGAFQNNGWVVNNLSGYTLYHLITGKKMFVGAGGNSGGYAPGTTICGSEKPLSISSTEFSGTQQTARTMCHELGHNLAGNAYHDMDCNACPNNPIMCTFVTGTPSQGCRGIYFSSTSLTQIENQLSQNSNCLSPIPAPTINQVYLSGNLINSTPYFTNIRNGNMSIDVTQPYPFYNTQVNFSPSNNAVSVSGNPNTTVIFNVPNSVNSFTMYISASNPCGTSYRSVPIVYGSGYRLYPNPATTVTYLEFETDPNNSKNDLFLPQTVTLKNEQNEVIKKNQPKQDFMDKKLEDGKRIKWDISTLPNGTYYVEVIYSEKNSSIIRLIIQK